MQYTSISPDPVNNCSFLWLGLTSFPHAFSKTLCCLNAELHYADDKLKTSELP